MSSANPQWIFWLDCDKSSANFNNATNVRQIYMETFDFTAIKVPQTLTEAPLI